MAKVDIDPGLFTTDVIVTLSDSEAKAVAAGGGAAAIESSLSIPPPFNFVVAGVIAAASADIGSKSQGHGVRVVVNVITVALSVSGWDVQGLGPPVSAVPAPGGGSPGKGQAPI